MKQKKLVSIAIAVFFIVAIGYTGAAARELVWANFVPKASPTVPPLQMFAKNVEKATQGKIKFKMYYRGEICKAKAIPGLVSSGGIDIGSFAPSYHTGDFPLASSLQLYPTMHRNTRISMDVWKGFLRDFPELTKEFTNQNMELLVRTASGIYLLISKKPIRNNEDMKGKRIRILGGQRPAMILKAAGGISVMMPSGEQYEALLRGAIDATQLTVGTHYKYKLYEVAKYCSMPVGVPMLYVTCMNVNTWNSLNESTKQVFKKEAKRFYQYDLERCLKSEKENMDNLKAAGVKFVKYSREDWEGILSKTGQPMDTLRTVLSDSGFGKNVIDRMVNLWIKLKKEGEDKYPEKSNYIAWDPFY